MSIGLRLQKPWLPLTEEAVTRLPGQLGIYQIADAAGTILFIGEAGARTPFGLRSELLREALARPAGQQFRVEADMQNHTRLLEPLMVHPAPHRRPPPPKAHN